MIKIFLSKIADKKLKALGFEKTVDTKYFVRYERGSKRQYLDILHKAHGPAIIQSYDPELWDEKGIGNTCFGITRGEAIAAAMKISSKRW